MSELTSRVNFSLESCSDMTNSSDSAILKEWHRIKTLFKSAVEWIIQICSNSDGFLKLIQIHASTESKEMIGDSSLAMGTPC